MANPTAMPAGYAFDAVLVPVVTSGAYSAGDIMGGLLTFPLAGAPDEGIIITGVQVVSKAAVTPALTLHLFNADPASTTKTDNAAYSLAAADAFKLRKSIALPTTWTDHGTPNSVSDDTLLIAMKPAAGAREVYGLLVDGTGVTLTSTSDIQVGIRGIGA